MASGLSGVVVLAFCATLAAVVFAGDRDCQSYTDKTYTYHPSTKCTIGYCCGSCENRYCCQNSFWRFSEEQQDECELFAESPLPMIFGIGSFVVILLIFICCCVCPCCCLYKMCRKPRPVIATTTHTTVVTSSPQQYPQQPMAAPAQSYQGAQYQPYQPVPVQPGYGAQPTVQGYGAQPMVQGYGGQPTVQGYGAQAMPTSPYHGQPFTAGPPPTYQEATGPSFPPNPMPYSQAAFSPGQPAYPLQPPVQPQPSGPPPPADFLAQPAYNPAYVAPPPKTG